MDEPRARLSRVEAGLLASTLELAERGRPAARPNPVVGALLATGTGEVLATGFHERVGAAHAERACLDGWHGAMPADATLYVSLEPCSHEGRQPPCTKVLLERGVKRVVYASRDSNPVTAGHGPAQLRAFGTLAELGPVDTERLALQQNAGFHSIHLRGRPYVTAKWAMTGNGRFSTGDPTQRWVSSVASREYVHWMRAGSGAVLVGVGTVLDDDPELTVRGPLAERIVQQPLRVVVDRQLRTPATSRLVRSASPQAPVLIATVPGAPQAAAAALRAAGVQVWQSSGRDGMLDELLLELGRRGVCDVLVEAGPTLLVAFFEAGLLDVLSVFVAPTLAPGNLPGLAMDHPLVDHALLADGSPMGDDQHHVRVLRPAWEFAPAGAPRS